MFTFICVHVILQMYFLEKNIGRNLKLQILLKRRIYFEKSDITNALSWKEYWEKSGIANA